MVFATCCGVSIASAPVNYYLLRSPQRASCYCCGWVLWDSFRATSVPFPMVIPNPKYCLGGLFMRRGTAQAKVTIEKTFSLLQLHPVEVLRQDWLRRSGRILCQ